MKFRPAKQLLCIVADVDGVSEKYYLFVQMQLASVFVCKSYLVNVAEQQK